MSLTHSELGVAVIAGASHIDAYLASNTDQNRERFLKSISDARWGKGRFAHRLVTHIRSEAASLVTQQEKNAIVPAYIQNSINYLIRRVITKRTS